MMVPFQQEEPFLNGLMSGGDKRKGKENTSEPLEQPW
jgi:hypothetical protein